MTNNQISVLIADDHPVVRGGLKALIDTEDGLCVVGQACDGQEAVEKYFELKPDVVVMDLVMPRKDGIEAISDIIFRDKKARILVLSNYEETDKIVLAIRAGTLGFVLKNSPPEDLLSAIREIYHGKVHIDPKIFQRVASYQEQSRPESFEEKLTTREREVVKLIAMGQTNEDVANTLMISARTVGVHISNILSKMHFTNRTQIVLYAIKGGLISLFKDTSE
jgi:NarL family two-component system response regulator LiaR